jgi:hypothetical protein
VDDVETVHAQVKDESLNLFFNCHQASIEEVLNEKVTQDEIHINFA